MLFFHAIDAGNQIGTCGFGYDEVRIEMEYQFGHSMHALLSDAHCMHQPVLFLGPLTLVTRAALPWHQV